MERKYNKESVVKHKEKAIKKVDKYIDTFLKGKKENLGKADKFSYWLEDYIKFLEYEDEFNPSKLKKYKRGEIVKVHLGYNIGSEEGGLHYAVVLDKNNSVYSPILTVIPLTSVKEKTNLNKLKRGSVYLGDEIYKNLQGKLLTTKAQAVSSYKELAQKVDKYNDSEDKSANAPVVKELKEQIKSVKQLIKSVEEIQKEIEKMKKGSIALINQITTLSKIRIYDPKHTADVLSNIRLSDSSLNKIDAKIVELYLK